MAMIMIITFYVFGDGLNLLSMSSRDQNIQKLEKVPLKLYLYVTLMGAFSN